MRKLCAVLFAVLAALEGGGVMLVGLRIAMKSGGSCPPASSYVQDGLIGMWDGVENAGPGVHDPAATAWADLSGHGQTMELHGPYFDAAALVLPKDASAYGVAAAKGPLKSSNGANTTVEFCGRVSSMVRSDSGSGIFWTLPTSQGFLAPFAARFAASDIVIATAQGQYFRYGSLFDGVDVQFAYTQSQSRVPTAYRRGAPAAVTRNNGYVNLGAVTKIGVGAMPSSLVSGSHWRRMQNFTLRVFSLRVYGRALTAAELARNCAVDKARFGGRA